MSSYTFSMEVPSLYFTSSSLIPEGNILLTVTDKQGVLLFKLVSTDSQSNLQGKSYSSILKALSSTRQSEENPDKSFFYPLTAFLNNILQSINNQGQMTFRPQMPSWDMTSHEETFIITYVYNQNITLKSRVASQEVNALEIFPQFTFGFNDASILPAFIGHFDPVRYLDMNRKKNPAKGTFSRNPYSGRSEALFTVMFESLGMDESWRDFFFVLEFMRLSLGFSMAREINQADTNRLGNQAYMRLLALTSFRGMFQNIIPPVILDPKPQKSSAKSSYDFTDTTGFDLLCQYIRECFLEPFQSRVPFWHLNTSVTLQNTPYMLTDPSIGNPNLVQFYRDKTSVSNLVSSMILPTWEARPYSEVLEKGVNTLFGSQIDAKTKAQVNQMVNNIDSYDLMSPVPFSLPTDVMGYDTRYLIPGTPKFLLRVKYIQKFYEKNENQTKCLYNRHFRHWSVQEFQQACANWAQTDDKGDKATAKALSCQVLTHEEEDEE